MARSLLALALAIALTVALAGCTSARLSSTQDGATTTGNVRVVTGVTYSPGLAADLYLPRGRAEGTAIVWIHGGGFVAGDKTQLAGLAQALAEQGYPGMAIQYHLSQGGAWFPASTLEDPGLQAAAASAVADANAAVAWLRSQGAAHGLTPSRVVLAGYSAGAITAATAASGKAAGTEPVDGAVSIAGAAVEPDRITASSPPLLMIHGALDDIVPVSLAETTSAAAHAQGVACDLVVVAGAGHTLPSQRMGVVVEAIERFLADLD